MVLPLRILCIEDDPADVLLIERYLEKADFAPLARRVDTLAQLDAALDEEWDVVLSDYAVPGLDCRAALEHIQAQHPDLPVILVSGSADDETALDLLDHGAWYAVLKDNLTPLAPAIRHSLDEARSRRDAERRLQAKREKFRAYFEQAPILLLVSDELGRFVDANPAALTTLGYDLPALTTLTIVDLPAPEEIGRVLADFGRLRDSGGCVEGEYRLRTRDGGTVWVSLRAARIAPNRFVAYAVDITGRKEADDHLRQMAAVFNATQEGVAVTDLNGHVLAVNAAFTTITEYAGAEVLGRRLNLLASGRHGPEFFQAMWRSLREAGFWQGEIWNRRKGGEIYPQWLTISTIPDAAGAPEKFVGVFTDISRIRHSTTLLEHLAHHDPLTDLPNRLLLVSRLEHMLDRIRRHGGHGALLFLDLDRFKPVNDTYGHLAGDEVLKKIALRLQPRLRDSDTLARLGGDEFVVLIDDIQTEEGAAHLAQHLLDLLGEPFDLDCGARVRIGCSIGICLFPRDGDSVATLLDHADVALYEAKHAGNTFRFYRPEPPSRPV